MGTEWTVHPLEDCMAAIIDYRGKTPRKTPSGIPLITAKVVKGGRIQQPDEFIAEADYEAWMRRGMPKTGDVVVTTEAPLGEVAQLGNERVALAQRLIALRGRPGVLDNTFLKFLMQSDDVQNQLRSRASGTTVFGVRQSELRKIALRLPPFSEQCAIGCILGALDERIDLNRRVNETVEATARAIFKSWFIGFDPVHSKVKGCTPDLPKVLADLFPSSFQESSLGEIPKGWTLTPFANTVQIIGGGTPRTSVAEYWHGDIPWFSVADAPRESDIWVIDTEKKISQAGIDNSSTSLLSEGTTIITARGTVGRVALVGVPMGMNQSCYALRGIVGPRGTFTYFSTRELVSTLQQHAHGSVFDTITRETLAGVVVASPPERLISAYEDTVEPYVQRIRTSLLQSHTLGKIRDALLPQLITGELRISHAERFVGGKV